MGRRPFALALVASLSLVIAGQVSAQTATGAQAAAAPTPALTLDEVITKNLDAKGGVARLKTIQTIKQTSRMTMQGMEVAVTVYSKRPNLLRQEASVGGQVVINAFDGQTPWMVNPLVGTPRPVTLSGVTADTIREQSSFEGPLVDYKNKPAVIELVGTEPLGGKTVYHLKLTTASKQVNHLYIDVATGLDVKLTTEADARTKVDQEFSDYRDVEGIKVPFVIKTFLNGVEQSEIKVQTVQFNLPMDDSMFRMPKG